LFNRKLSLYFAAQYHRRFDLRETAEWINKNLSSKYTVVSRWLWDDSETDLENRDYCNLSAIRDFNDIVVADLLVLFNEEKGGEGRHIEFGYAVAKRKPIFVVGKMTSVFHFHNQVELQFKDMDNLLNFLESREISIQKGSVLITG